MTSTRYRGLSERKLIGDRKLRGSGSRIEMKRIKDIAIQASAVFSGGVRLPIQANVPTSPNTRNGVEDNRDLDIQPNVVKGVDQPAPATLAFRSKQAVDSTMRTATARSGG